MSGKKRILVVARQPVGGIRTYFSYVYSHCVFDQYEFTFITPHFELSDYLNEIFHGRVFRYIEVERSERALAIAVWKELRARNYDLVHSHGFTAGILSSLPANLCRVPHIMTAHDVMLDWQ